MSEKQLNYILTTKYIMNTQ